jgi:xylulokinase
VLETTIGTAGIVSTALGGFVENPEGRLQIFCNVMPSAWHAMGVTLAAGGSLEWLSRELAQQEIRKAWSSGRDPFELICGEAEKSPPGSHGVILLPYLQGERCPHVDADARGAFIGLSLGTHRRDLFRSVMEGVIFSFRDVAALFAQAGMEFGSIATSGGGALSGLWRQIQADIFQKRVVTVSSP